MKEGRALSLPPFSDSPKSWVVLLFDMIAVQSFLSELTALK